MPDGIHEMCCKNCIKKWFVPTKVQSIKTRIKQDEYL